MIQRIQTIYLILASACFFYFSASNFAWVLDNGNTEIVFTTKNFPIMYWYSIILGVISLIAIFLYKNLRTQVNVVWGVALLSVILIFMLFYNIVNNALEVQQYRIYFGAFLPSLGFIFSLLAGRGISKDQQALKSSDRLR